MAVERVTFQGVTQAGLQENVVHYFNPDGLTTHAAIGAYLQANWINPLLGIQSTSFNWVQMVISRVDGGPSNSTTIIINPNQGTQAGDAAPPFVAGLIQLVTATVGRRGRGRIYLPGLPIGFFPFQGKLTPTGYTNVQTNLLNAWRTKFLVGGTAPVTLTVSPRNDPSTHNDVIALDIRLWASVQRRRNYFVGA